ncbi:MAG TPA: dipeptide epimerase, partial [Pseudolabrys sp.]|nr:dipeptide epimerase [Pseudolabrys sp.]
MHIKSIEPIAVSLPMLKPVIMAGEEVRRADNVLVRIEADNGLVGWGEAASAPVMTGETLESIVSAVHYLEPALRGRPVADIAGALAAMNGRMYGNHGAKAAIEIALHDLTGRATAKPVHA